LRGPSLQGRFGQSSKSALSQLPREMVISNLDFYPVSSYKSDGGCHKPAHVAHGITASNPIVLLLS
jgi:hypothetical protein